MESPLDLLRKLPRRRAETWQGGWFRTPGWISEEPGPAYRPYLPLWVAVQADKIHTGRLVRPEQRDPRDVLQALLDFACWSEFGNYVPGRLEVVDQELADYLSTELSGIDVEIRVVDRLPAVESMLASLEDHMTRGRVQLPSVLVPGMTQERLRRFAEAAAAFYRAAPWQHLTDVDLIQIEQPHGPPGMRHAVVLGAARVVRGLALYRSAADLFRLHATADETPWQPEEAWRFAFHALPDLPPEDADLWEDQRLPVADKGAYPLVTRHLRGSLTRPGPAELAFLEGLLWTLAATTEGQIDSGRWHHEVTTADGQTAYTLAVPDLLEPPSYQAWFKRGFTPDRRANERMFADMDRYFREHPPANVEEANEVLARVFSGKKADQLVTQPATPLEKAQELCYQAFETYGRRRVQLAGQALETCPDCADAYVILGEQSGSLEAALEHFAQGMAAGERAIGPEVFQETVGRFWGVSETRPYMRARFGLAQLLEENGRAEEAIEHFQELLRLNPNDNQGVRYLLLPKLLTVGRDVEAARLLKQFDENSAVWAYGRLLLAFRLSPRSPAVRDALRSALAVNRYVPELLLDKDAAPPAPEAYTRGSPEEAVICATELWPAFAATEGSLEWLVAELREHARAAHRHKRAQRQKARERRKKRKGR